MPFFPLKKIDALAESHAVYLTGVKLYNGGAVRQFVQTDGGSLCAQLVMAAVGEAPYMTEVGFGEDGNPLFFKCSCGFSGHGMCAHLAAMLVRKYYDDMVDGLSGGGAPAPVTRRSSDDAAKRLMGRLVARRAALLDAVCDKQGVQLKATLRIDGGTPRISFRIGREQLYVLKDISRFCADMMAARTVSYGKALTFVHQPDAFTPSCRPLLSFLCGEYGDMQPMGHGAYDVNHVGKELPLTPGAFDRFFDLFNGSELTAADGELLTFADGIPALEMAVDGSLPYGLSLALTQPVTVIRGSNRLYVRCGDTLWRTPVGYGDDMEDILQICGDGRSLFVAEEDLDDFVGSVIAAAGDRITLIGDTERLLAHRARLLVAALYLDAPDRKTVSFEWKFRYGEEVFNPLLPGDGAVAARDRLAEVRAMAVLRRYAGDAVERDGQLLWTPDEEELYHFIREGVAALDAVGEVYATAAFSRIGTPLRPHARVGVRMENDLLQLDVDIPELSMEELAEVLHSYRLAKQFHRLRDGRFLSLDNEALQGLSALAEDLGIDDAAWQNGMLSVPLYRALYVDRLLDGRDRLQYDPDGGFRRLVDGMRHFEEAPCELPEGICAEVRDYQKSGYRWMMALQRAGFGGILADDMGLGKTLQVIAVLLKARREGNLLPSLVVCPASLVLNWESEIRRFAPELTVLPVLGSMTDRAEQMRTVRGYDVVITSYDLLKRDLAGYADREFFYEVLDEAQYIKNHNTLNARAVKAIKARHRIAVTGTPIENHLSELWSIFDFLMPGYLFDNARFRDELETPIVRDGSTAARARLLRLTAPFILRRLKKDVLRELPPKTERVQLVPFGTDQAKLYTAALAEARTSVAASGGKNQIAILAQLMRLRQICCHPGLCFENYDGESAKFESCMELLHEATAAGHKVLLFSQFTSMLAILRERITAEGLSCFVLQGSTPKEERIELVDRFNRDDTQVFLISLKAGGTGLNLTGADVVIHYDPWWNVAAQNQATDRAYRIGQNRSVQVIRLIVHDTVEERILQMQEKKSELADAVIREDGGNFADMTANDLLALLNE